MPSIFPPQLSQSSPTSPSARCRYLLDLARDLKAAKYAALPSSRRWPGKEIA